tara:strand:- start:10587 stop:10886 length:300 start_codon:yes stop_codon:yes gene_type:complete
MSGEAGRDEGIGRVLDNAGTWKHRSRNLVMNTDELTGRLMTGEDIRLYVSQRVGSPHHHNAWGGLIMGLVKRKRLVEVDRVKMRDPRSHARKTPVYRVS